MLSLISHVFPPFDINPIRLNSSIMSNTLQVFKLSDFVFCATLYYDLKSFGGFLMKIEVMLTDALFRRFTLFDILKRRKMWRSPVIFASILGSCAIICFIMHHVEGAVMLGSVLLLVGLGMPLVYFATFFSSLRKEVKNQQLTTPRLVYTLELTEKPDGIFIRNKKEKASYKWEQTFHAYRDKKATYLFITANRGFILPHDCVTEGSDALWELLTKMLPEDRCTVL